MKQAFLSQKRLHIRMKFKSNLSYIIIININHNYFITILFLFYVKRQMSFCGDIYNMWIYLWLQRSTLYKCLWSKFYPTIVAIFNRNRPAVYKDRDLIFTIQRKQLSESACNDVITTYQLHLQLKGFAVKPYSH